MTIRQVIPMPPVKNVRASIAFYERLGFEVESANDGWGWAMMRCGSCALMLDQSINPHPPLPRTGVVYLYPDDIVAYHGGLRRLGLDVPDLETTFYGMTEFRLEDPDGNRLWIGAARANPTT